MTMPSDQPQGQYGQGRYGQGPHHGQYGDQPRQDGPQYGVPTGQPTWARPPAPPLSPRQRNGAFIAGAVGMNLVNIGGTMLLAALILGVILAFFSAVLSAAARSGDAVVDPQALAFFDLLQSVNAPAWLIGGGLLGLVILVLGVLTSFWILRAHGVVRPWGVTWSAVGISIPALVIVSSALSVLGQIVGTLSLSSLFPTPGAAVPDAAAVGLGTGIALVVVSFVVSLVLVAAIGALIWWWMAHVLRRPPAA